jgi:anti-sigma factor RsiW
MSPARQPADGDLHAYLDGELPPSDMAAVEEWLARDPEAAERLRAFRAIDQRLKGAFEFVLEEPQTKAMQAMLLKGRIARHVPSPRIRWRSLAAAVAIALSSGGAGYLLHDIIVPPQLRERFVETAIGAHSVFVGEVRHPVEVVANEEEHLVKWLTKRVGHDLKAPGLSGLGFNLVGGRLLADSGRPAAQFMYENGKGQRLTLYIRREDKRRDSSFEFIGHGDVSAFYWIDHPLAYALIGKLPREDLQKVARATYEQLQR